MPARSVAAPGPPAPAPVLQLLGPLKATDSALRLEQRRLLAARPRWQADPVGRFLIDRRLGQNYSALRVNDSAHLFLRRASRGAAPLLPAYAVDVSIVYQRLGDYYFHQRQAYDSAAAAYAEQGRLLRASGHSLTAVAPAVLLEGPSDLRVGMAVAQAAANAGLALRQKGDMARPVRYFHEALQQFTAIDNGPGIMWASGLIGNSYQTQGNIGKASEAYEIGWQAARRVRADANRVDEFVAMRSILEAYATVLIQQQRTAYFLSIAQEVRSRGETLLATSLSADHQPEVLKGLIVVHYQTARGHLERHEPVGAAQALTRLDGVLHRLYTLSGSAAAWREQDNYLFMAHASSLRAWLAAMQRDRPGQARSTTRAMAYLDSIAHPTDRLLTTHAVAAYFTKYGAYHEAATLLEPLAQQLRDMHARFMLRGVYVTLIDAYAGARQYEPAFRTQQLHRALNDTLRSAQQYATLADADTRYHTAQKEARIRILTQRQQVQQARAAQQQTRFVGLLAGAGLLGAGLVVAAWLTMRLRRSRTVLATRNSELAAARATQDRLYSVIGHDLRTPLTALEGLATLIDYYYQPANRDAAAMQEVTAEVRQTTHQLTALLDNLLHWAANQSGELSYCPEPVSVAELLHESAALYEPAARARQVALTVSVAGGLPALWADRNMVLTQLRNLLGNALKVAPPGSAVELAAAATAEGVALTVRDAGPGLSAGQLATLQQAAGQDSLAPRLPGQRGTGLGLPLVRQLARRQRGTFTLASTPGQGTVARLVLPDVAQR